MSVVISYRNLLAYFYIALYTTFLSSIIIDKYQFKSMMTYNIYIK